MGQDHTPPFVEQRQLPRAHGTLHLRYHRGDDIAAWLAGGPPQGQERTPDPTMNFSAGGVAFDDEPACEDGDTLLFELGIPDDPRRWRGAARVLRVSRIPIDERDDFFTATHRIAAQVLTLPEEGIDALQAYTSLTRQANGRHR